MAFDYVYKIDRFGDSLPMVVSQKTSMPECLKGASAVGASRVGEEALEAIVLDVRAPARLRRQAAELLRFTIGIDRRETS